MTTAEPGPDTSNTANPMLTLLELGRLSRRAASANELAFLLVNETRALIPYRQAAIWIQQTGIRTLSGVVQVEANAPYAQWLGRVMAHCAATHDTPQMLDAWQLPTQLAADWAEWLPPHACWLPFIGADKLDGRAASGGVIFACEAPLTQQELALLTEWVDIWLVAWKAQAGQQTWNWRAVSGGLGKLLRPPEDKGRPWWKTRMARLAVAVLVTLAFPVRLTVLAPAELVPMHPSIVRAPLDGVIESFAVQPNQKVRAGQLLFTFDEALVRSRLAVARHEALTAQAELRQASQAAMLDANARLQLSGLTGKVQERQAEVAYIEQQLARTQVLAPSDGIVLVDEPSEWIGRPISTGQTVLRIATPGDTEVEAWLGLADAIPLPAGAPVTLHLNASPLSPVHATVRYMAFEPVERPAGDYAYRLRATPDGPVTHRVGLKGTARISGRRVPLGYWITRRALGAIRSWLGW